ncbi:DUF1684 domain-containing protein [Niabella terrae]
MKTVHYLYTGFLTCALLLLTNSGQAQTSYMDSIRHFQMRYVKEHEVARSASSKSQIAFYPVDSQYQVLARFEPVPDSKWFRVPTSSGRSKIFRKAGKLCFQLKDLEQTLYVYQSQVLLQDPQYWDLLFLMFTDSTTGYTTYEGGRYIDLKQSDLRDGHILVDFNKAYNPYCAYGIGGKYNCPIPPSDNRLGIAIYAGEKSFPAHSD